MRVMGQEQVFSKMADLCGSAVGGVASVLAALSQLAEALLGVSLPVAMGSAAGAFAARAVLPACGFWRALAMTVMWAVLGCVLSPLVQALLPLAVSIAQWLLPAALAGVQIALPANVQAAVAAGVAAVPWWGPRVWPWVVARFPALGGAAGGPPAGGAPPGGNPGGPSHG
jgi:hypothetical protein